MWKQYSVNYFPWNEGDKSSRKDHGELVRVIGTSTFVGAPSAYVPKITTNHELKPPKTFVGASVNKPVFQKKPSVSGKDLAEIEQNINKMSSSYYTSVKDKIYRHKPLLALEDTLFLDSNETKGNRICEKLNHHHGHLIIHGHGDDTKKHYGNLLLKGKSDIETNVKDALDKLLDWCTNPKSMSFFVYFVNCHSAERWGIGKRAMEWFKAKPIYPLGVYGVMGEIKDSTKGIFGLRIINTGQKEIGWTTLHGPKFDDLMENIALVQEGYDGQIKMKNLSIILK